MFSPTRLASIALVGAMTLSVAAASSEPEYTDAGLLIVGTDDAGDWGAQGNNSASPVGERQGQDLLQAAVGLSPDDASVLLFEITVSELPTIGGMPEASRYTWNFEVDGEFAEIDGKYTNYSRGACDPTSGACPPPRDPGPAPFTLRGNCTVVEGSSVTTCEELGRFVGIFDVAAGTITIPVPLDAIGAGECTEIQPGINLFDGSISAAPSAFFTSGAGPMDTMYLRGTYVIPMADGSDCPVDESDED